MPQPSSLSVRVFYPRFDTAGVVAAIRAGLESLGSQLPLRRVVLFGSYARGNYTVASDVDLLVIYQGPPRDDAYAVVKKALPIRRLEPHIYSEGEYRQLQKVIERMGAGGIVIYEEGLPAP